ncbi:MAG: hypothetical protein BME94_05860 [Methanobacteriales archaeon Met13]
MKWIFVVVALLMIIVSYSYITISNGPIEPLGRVAFVKFLNPDFYPGHPHSQLLAQYAKDRGSKCALVTHFGGSSRYRSYQEGDVFIISLAFIDTQGTGAVGPTNYLDSLQIALFGVPDGRYKYKSDGMVFNTYEEAMDHVYTLAKQHGQTGPLPMAWHGNARQGNPILIPGCGFPLYFQILTKTYGVVPAYVYTIYGMIFPYLNNRYAHYELANYQQLQVLYKDGNLDYS